jgi:16S rRNA (cytosine967-C5)-methyltransferase
MTPAARISAAIEVLADIAAKRRPAPEALKDWGIAHRFAGSGDRAAIAGLVYDALRRRASSAFVMGEETPRAIMLGMLRLERKLDMNEIAKLFDGSRFAPLPLAAEERTQLDAADLSKAPAHVAGDYPEWLDPHFARVFGDERAEEGAALASRAPLDLRVNLLKGERSDVLPELSEYSAEPTRWSPWGARIVLSPDAKNPAVQSDPAFLKGLIEIQDEGSQLAALLSAAKPGEQVIDLCAGGGGKTLALAAMMQNKGQIFATDSDKRRLAPIHARLERAGVRNVQVLTPRKDVDALSGLDGSADLVLIDAPCTGTGSWRRNPDAKWRLRPGALEIRNREQVAVLDRAVSLLKPGGRIVYITCSVLDEENGAQVRDFLARHSSMRMTAPASMASQMMGERAMLFTRAARLSSEGLLMTPRGTDTDGFFVSMLSNVS